MGLGIKLLLGMPRETIMSVSACPGMKAPITPCWGLPGV